MLVKYPIMIKNEFMIIKGFEKYKLKQTQIILSVNNSETNRDSISKDSKGLLYHNKKKSPENYLIFYHFKLQYYQTETRCFFFFFNLTP